MREPKTATGTMQQQVIGGALDDKALVSALLQRDTRAWRELERAIQPTVRRAISRALAPFGNVASDEMEEVIATFYLSLVQDDMADLRSFDVQHKRGMRLASWLYLLAYRTALNHMRGQTRYQALIDRFIVEECDDEMILKLPRGVESVPTGAAPCAAAQAVAA